jgi:hypothetical protein
MFLSLKIPSSQLSLSITYRISREPACCVWFLFKGENDRSIDAAVGMINNKADNSVISDNAVHEAINYFRKSETLCYNDSSDKRVPESSVFRSESKYRPCDPNNDL